MSSAASTSQSLTVPPRCKRYNAVLMYGRHACDDDMLPSGDLDTLVTLRASADAAVSSRDLDKFLDICYATVRLMERLPSKNPLHFPEYLSFVNAPAPWNDVFKKGLANIFAKVMDVRATARNTTIRPNNASGMALAGGRGVGKSNGLRLLTLVPALLFPRDIVSVYVDYAGTTMKPPPSQLLRDALRCATGEEGLPAPDAPLECVLDAIEDNDRVAVFAGDEFETVYGTATIWGELHVLATKYTPTLFLADSGFKVRAMIERRGHERDLRRWFPTLASNLPASLNQDKLAVTQLLPFTTREQYRTFLASRAGLLLAHPAEQSLTTQEQDLVIAGLHARSGGRLRAMQRLPIERQTHFRLPPPGTAARAVLEHLRAEQAARIGVHDPFQMVTVPDTQVREWLASRPRHDDDTDINSLLNANILQETASGELTFGSYDLYRQLRQQRPRVFFSLAWADREHSSVTALRSEIDRRGVADSVLCTDAAATDAMSTDGLAPWMRDIATPRVDHYVVILLSDAYLRRAAISGSGVHTELTAAVSWMRKAAPGPDAYKHIVIVNLDSMDKLADWRASQPLVADLVDRAMVYSVPSDGDGEHRSSAVQRIADRILGAPARPAPADDVHPTR